MSGSAISTVVTAAVAAVTAAAIPHLQVCDGPNWEPDVLSLEVGWAGQGVDAVEAVTVTRTPFNASMRSYTETVAVTCLLSYHHGDITIAEARDTVTATFDLVDAVFASDPSLGGAVSGAFITDIGYVPLLEEGGPTTMLRFTFAARSFA